jgi:hypothetical protein
MRYANAQHIDYSGLLGRRQQIGIPFAVAGGIMIAASVCYGSGICTHLLLLVNFLLWLAAWYLAVGILFRLPLSAAILLQLTIISCQQLDYL